MILREKWFLEWRQEQVQCIMSQLQGWQQRMLHVQTKEELDSLTQEGDCLRADYCHFVLGWNRQDFWKLVQK